VACGLVVLLLAVYVPAPVVSGPALADGVQPQCHDVLTSSIAPLAAYSSKDVWINYTVNGSHDGRGLRWTELWYQGPGSDAWVLYAPPWNPTGHWSGTSAKDHPDDDEEGGHAATNGAIIFDTTFTGGDGFYNFTTVAVGRHHVREPGPPRQSARVKANTTVDSEPPILFLTKPTPGSWTNSEWLQWQATDRVSGVASVSVSVDGGEMQNFSDASGSMNMSLATQGLHSVVVTATDHAGNAITIPSSFHYDTNAPSLQITSPEPNTYLNASSVNVEWTMGDAAGISNLQLSIDSSLPVSLSNETTAYPLAGLADSGHLVTLLAADPAGNVAVQAVAFTIDTTAPTLQIVTPANGSYSNGHQIQAVWMGADSGSGIDHYRISLDGASPITLTNAPGYIFPDAVEGVHHISVQAYDRAGNMAQATSTVTVDYTPPVISITAPRPGATVYGTVSVNWTASDAGSGLAQVNLVTDSAPVPIAVGQTTMALPASLSTGAHAVTIQAWDRAGNQNVTTVGFTYGGAFSPSPTPASVPALDFWWIVAIVLTIAVGSAYFAVRRRKRKA
jgi:hypothetical protein